MRAFSPLAIVAAAGIAQALPILFSQCTWTATDHAGQAWYCCAPRGASLLRLGLRICNRCDFYRLGRNECQSNHRSCADNQGCDTGTNCRTYNKSRCHDAAANNQSYFTTDIKSRDNDATATDDDESSGNDTSASDHKGRDNDATTTDKCTANSLTANYKSYDNTAAAGDDKRSGNDTSTAHVEGRDNATTTDRITDNDVTAYSKSRCHSTATDDDESSGNNASTADVEDRDNNSTITDNSTDNDAAGADVESGGKNASTVDVNGRDNDTTATTEGRATADKQTNCPNNTSCADESPHRGANDCSPARPDTYTDKSTADNGTNDIGKGVSFCNLDIGAHDKQYVQSQTQDMRQLRCSRWVH
uniref:Secreted protein n=1 Tax=Achlya hypogyna TaxID=1202772 RepID=A0A0A7CNY6_ACHHY|nr:secreted protein [Achlya hypogyna]